MSRRPGDTSDHWWEEVPEDDIAYGLYKGRSGVWGYPEKDVPKELEYFNPLHLFQEPEPALEGEYISFDERMNFRKS